MKYRIRFGFEKLQSVHLCYPRLSTYNIEFMQQGEHSQKVTG